MSFGKKCLEFRANHNLTQKQFADIIGVNAFMIYRYENEISEPSAVNKIKFENKMKEYEVNKNV